MPEGRTPSHRLMTENGIAERLLVVRAKPDSRPGCRLRGPP
ncbi:hypothetical protein PUR34_19540 [Streptomyces sp. JV185]|nr:hypothetical protein [Streptomyces sp. JV185]MEE1770266.1 hypothetical protein [Streptomyces sp. JV185]